MNLSTSTRPISDPVLDLSQRLPRESIARARAQRVLTNPSWVRRLRDVLGLPTLSPQVAGQVHGTVLNLQCQSGQIQVVIDTNKLPALSMALALPKPHTALAVTQALLSELVDALTDCLPGLALESIGGTSSEHRTLAHVRWGDVHVGILQCDAAVLAHLMRQRHIEPKDLAPWMSLRVFVRLELMVRHWPISVMRTVRPGDVVLMPGQDIHHLPLLRLSLGDGAVLHHRVRLDIQEHALYIATPHPASHAQENVPIDQDPSGALDGLEVPVTFELETTRLSLAELAELQPGHMIELHAPLLEALVRIHHQGQTLGAGQLVALGEQLGVRIIDMKFQGDAPVPEPTSSAPQELAKAHTGA